MKNKKEEQEGWQAELDALNNEGGGYSRGWYRDTPQAKGGTHWSDSDYTGSHSEYKGSQYSNTPVTYGNWWRPTSKVDVDRWKTGGSSNFYNWGTMTSQTDIALIIAEQTVRTANAVANHSVKDKDGKEQFLSLRIAKSVVDEAGAANTCLQPTVYISDEWITQAIEDGLNDGEPHQVNEKINKLADAYSGQALVLATIKTTMDKDVARRANELISKLENPLLTHSLSEQTIVESAGLSLWRTAEFEHAKKVMLNDWPGFSSYTDAAQAKVSPQKIRDTIHVAAREAEAMKQFIEYGQKDVDAMVAASGGKFTPHALSQQSLLNSIRLRRTQSQVLATATALNYVTSGRKDKITLPPEILGCVKHVIKHPVPPGTTLDQALSISGEILKYFKEERHEPPPEQPPEQPPEGGGGGGGEAGGEKDKDGDEPIEAGDKPNPDGCWGVHDPDTNPTTVESNGVGSMPTTNSASDSDVVTSMQPQEISVNPDSLVTDIHMCAGVTRGWMVQGFRPTLLAQRELLSQLAEPIARIVKSKIMFRASASHFEVVGLRKGDIDEGNLYMAGHDTKVFSRKTEITKPTVAVGILLDQSGSMNQQGVVTFTPNLSKINEALAKEGLTHRAIHGSPVFRLDDPEIRRLFKRHPGRFGCNAVTSGDATRIGLSRSDQVTAVAAGIYLGLEQLLGVSLFICGFHSAHIDAIHKEERMNDVYVPPTLRQYHQANKELGYPMRLMEYASKHVGKLTKDKLFSRLCNVNSDFANSDGFAIMHAAARLNELHPETKMKVLFVLSDGQPSCSHEHLTKEGNDWVKSRDHRGSQYYHGRSAMKHIREVSRWSAIHLGVQVRGIGIDSAYSTIDGRIMYGENNSTVLTDIASSANVISAFLARTFHKLGM